ncbi:MAG: TolC family protein [Synergistaceae bacterium]|nr:TolC family protein [Synergistaceae bacterium]
MRILIFSLFAVCLAARLCAASETLSVDLDEAYQIALANSDVLKIAESDVKMAGEGRRQAHRQRGVTVQLSHESSRTNYYYERENIGTFGNQLTASYPIYTGGRISSGIAMAEAEISSKRAILERTKQDLRMTVAEAYFTVLGAENLAHLSRESVERIRSHVANVSVQFENGRIGKSDMLRSEVELADTEQQMITAGSNYEIALKSLNKAMGIPIDTRLEVKGNLPYIKYGHTLDECLTHAMSRHMDLESARFLIEKARAGVESAKSERRPVASLNLTEDLYSTKHWPGFDAKEFKIAVDMEYTLIDSGTSASKIEAALEQQKQAEVNYDSVADTIIFDVTTAFMQMVAAEKRIITTSSAVVKARDVYEIEVARYEEGVGMNIDVIDAENALNQANSNNTQALCDYNMAQARLENSMGGAIEPITTDK